MRHLLILGGPTNAFDLEFADAALNCSFWRAGFGDEKILTWFTFLICVLFLSFQKNFKKMPSLRSLVQMIAYFCYFLAKKSISNV